MRGRYPVIAIDGPSGVGKSSLSKLLARHFGLKYLDTGAMYRAVALNAYERGVDLDDDKELRSFCSGLKIDVVEDRIYIDGKEYRDKIRTPLAGRLASIASSKPAIRETLIELQRAFGRDGSVILEGRDIGTIVFPDADVKFFLEATFQTRVERRYKQLKGNGMAVDIEMVEEEIRDRDLRDTTREFSPLRKAKDAIVIDTSSYTLEEVYRIMVKEIERRLKDRRE